MAPKSKRSAKPALNPKQQQFVKIRALQLLCVHYGLIAPCPAFKHTQAEIQKRFKEFGPLPLISAIDTLFDQNKSDVQRIAAGTIIEVFCPGWRGILPATIVGQVVERNDIETSLWKKAVLKRDGHKCVKCGTSESLEAHHIIRWVDYPQTRICTDNGMTLCKNCHGKEHGKKVDA